MKRVLAFACVAVLALGSWASALAKPLPTARHLVPVPPIGLSRRGGAPIQTVSRGARPDPRRLPDLTPLASPLPTRHLLPQRAQVLALRHRVRQRYHGRGRGARLAIELP